MHRERAGQDPDERRCAVLARACANAGHGGFLLWSTLVEGVPVEEIARSRKEKPERVMDEIHKALRQIRRDFERSGINP